MSTKISHVIRYNQNFLSLEEATKLFQKLMQFPELINMHKNKVPQADTITYNFGKLMFLDRDLIEKNAFPKALWGNTTEWPAFILPLKKKIEEFTGCEFKTCVCIYYPDGNSGVGYHSDKIAFGDTDVIPSISLGEERVFCVRENSTKKETQFLLKHGSLLLMKKGCQEYFEHSLPKNSIYVNPRINLTFRKYGF
ncbi:alpha-ketoglutarate-dependent dioxygenase AlkB [Tenacibaculum tangerinum]|uniref:Alpha-ketoglutarate-dependent dioxygenase AlkB n=1 Tax=Tenacibaculum tangerinum TaxID=3038772 RepID=A0ABY8KZK9_9FLAO|nr:alpha-ketoglutarate-dependent dioxygenase AlkB [Tenacibaculum tangerinum]WGH74663.1 alpha-ketoglutarate-dependent dioxygenase AlkB [Tenacibaculum tangerinum]